MATVTLLEKARQGRLAALASLKNRHARPENIVSIFDFAFDTQAQDTADTPADAVQFRSSRTHNDTPAVLAA